MKLIAPEQNLFNSVRHQQAVCNQSKDSGGGLFSMAAWVLARCDDEVLHLYDLFDPNLAILNQFWPLAVQHS